MQTNNSKNKQLPFQVVAEQNLTLPFNSELPSSLSVERINQLNYLAYDAEVRYGERSGDAVGEGAMLVEAFGLVEVLEVLCYFDDDVNFHSNINSAFKELIKSHPENIESIFNTYRDLTVLFRVLLKQQLYLHQKLDDYNAIADDFNTLDTENVERMRGGRNNGK